MIIEQLKKLKIQINFLKYKLNREKFLKEKSKKRLDYEIDLENPITFNEKIIWLKLYWYSNLATSCVDKYEVRKYIIEKGYSDLLIPIYGVYDNFEEIDFSLLPSEYVLKVTHNSGGVVVVNEKNPLDLKRTKSIIKKSMKRNYYHQSQEWVYKDLKPRIICEEFIQTTNGDIPRDYKLFCSNGKVQFLYVASERGHIDGNATTKFDFYSKEWELLDVKQGYERSNIKIQKPNNFDEMIAVAEDLSKAFPQVRVDFYNEGNVLKFGELTFFHLSGMTKFEPQEYDEIFGELIDISDVKKMVYADEQ